MGKLKDVEAKVASVSEESGDSIFFSVFSFIWLAGVLVFGYLNIPRSWDAIKAAFNEGFGHGVNDLTPMIYLVVGVVTLAALFHMISLIGVVFKRRKKDQATVTTQIVTTV